MKLLYYAHSRLSYGTRKEKRELRLIKKQFPDHQIINPAEINFTLTSEAEIIKECKDIVKKVNIMIASEYKKHIGRGVFTELNVETKAKKIVLRKKKFIEDFKIIMINRNDWHVRYGKIVGGVDANQKNLRSRL
jgi:L-lactate utilization protein LutC